MWPQERFRVVDTGVVCYRNIGWVENGWLCRLVCWPISCRICLTTPSFCSRCICLCIFYDNLRSYATATPEMRSDYCSPQNDHNEYVELYI